MGTFSQEYEHTFRTLGLKLSELDAIPERFLARFERKMEFRVPRALREYYLLAGNELDFNTVYNRLLPPTEWWFDDGRLARELDLRWEDA